MFLHDQASAQLIAREICSSVKQKRSWLGNRFAPHCHYQAQAGLLGEVLGKRGIATKAPKKPDQFCMVLGVHQSCVIAVGYCLRCRHVGEGAMRYTMGSRNST